MPIARCASPTGRARDASLIWGGFPERLARAGAKRQKVRCSGHVDPSDRTGHLDSKSTTDSRSLQLSPPLPSRTSPRRALSPRLLWLSSASEACAATATAAPLPQPVQAPIPTSPCYKASLATPLALLLPLPPPDLPRNFLFSSRRNPPHLPAHDRLLLPNLLSTPTTSDTHCSRRPPARTRRTHLRPPDTSVL